MTAPTRHRARLLVAGLLLAALACAEGEPEARARRVLLVGIDGANLRVMEPLLARGELPFLAGLARDGASGPLLSFRPLWSPRIWNTIATGKSPEKHGIEAFTFEDASGEQRLYLSHHRKAHALWNIAARAGRRVAVVNWWNTYPPDLLPEGSVVISDHARPQRIRELQELTGADGAPVGAVTAPPAWQARARAIFQQPSHERVPLTTVDDPFLGNVGIARWMKKEELSRRYRDDEATTRLALAVEAETRPELLMVFLPGIDRVSHRLWAGFEPPERYPAHLRLRPRQHQAAREAVEDYYRFTDALLALLAADFGPEDLVMVVSDHGFEAGQYLEDLTGIHDSEAAQEGIVFARGPGIAAGSGSAGATVNDVAPAVLAALGLPIARDMDGGVPGFLAAGEVAVVDSHDAGEIARAGLGPSGSEEAILEQLRALGYID